MGLWLDIHNGNEWTIVLSWLKIVVNQDQELEENKETKNLHAVGSLILHIGMIINCSFDGLLTPKT